MKNKILICAFLAPIFLCADSIGGNVFYSTDSDVDVSRVTALGSQTISNGFDIGASITHGSISGYESTKPALFFDLKKSDFTVQANLGRESYGNEIVGNIDINFVQKYLILGAFVQKDIVDSELGMQDNITFDAYGASVEITNSEAGIVISNAKYDYEDKTKKEQINAKVYYSFFDGISLFASTQHYENNKHSIYFFSPDEYNRHLFGMNLRQRVFDGILSVQLATGKQIVNNEKSEKSDFLKVGFDKKINDSWYFKSEFIYDKKQPEYAYKQTIVSLIYNF